MMSENKSKTLRRWLLIGVSALLVTVISVGATVAYLTATTDTKVNTFTAAGNIRGKLKEPNFDSTKTYLSSPGNTVNKDPLVQNLTTTDRIIVGARLKFEINITDSTDANYQPVSLETFSRFVDITWNKEDTNNTTKITGSSQKWVLLENKSSTPYPVSYIYDAVLGKYDGTEINSATPSNLTTYDTNNSADSGKPDNSRPIFTAVTLKSSVPIMDGGTVTSLASMPAGTSKETSFPVFNFRIKIDSYGVNASSVPGDTDDAKIEYLANTSGSTATNDQMLTKLASL